MDESKLLSHQTKLEQWQERQEEKKHLFTITQDNLSSGSPGSGSSPATPSRGGKVGTPLPSIQYCMLKNGGLGGPWHVTLKKLGGGMS